MKTGKLKLAGNGEDSTFIYGGFCNKMDTTRCFSRHEDSTIHKTVVEVGTILPKTTRDVGEMLSSTLAVKSTTIMSILSRLLII